MLVKQDDTAACHDLFALIETRLHDDDRRLVAPTALLRLKASIAAAANAELCLAALADLRSVLGRADAARGELAQRCRMLEAALRELQDEGKAPSVKAWIAEPGELPTGRDGLGDAGPFANRMTRVFGTRTAPPSLAVLRIGLGPIDDVAAEEGSATRAQLRQLASARMARAMRAADIVTRAETDGFACVLPDLSSREQLTQLACRMLDLVSAPMQIDEVQFSLRPSIGIAVCPHDGDTPDELLKTAGTAMRRARAQGSGYAFSNARAEVWASQFSNLREQEAVGRSIGVDSEAGNDPAGKHCDEDRRD